MTFAIPGRGSTTCGWGSGTCPGSPPPNPVSLQSGWSMTHVAPAPGFDATGASGGRGAEEEVEADAVTAVRIAPTEITRAMSARSDVRIMCPFRTGPGGASDRSGTSVRPVGFPRVKVTARAADEGGTGRVLPGAGGPAMSIKPFSDRTTIPFGIGVLATLVVVVGWLVF